MTHPATGLFAAINDFARATPWLNGPVLTFASDGVVLFAVFLIVGWWIARHRDAPTMAIALWAPFGMLLAIAVNQPIGNAVREARPYTSLSDILVLVHRSTDFSFPSDHAVMAGAVATGVLLVDRRLGAVAWVAALLLAFSRVYIAAHYPHDVVVGLLLGSAVALVTAWLARRPLARLVQSLEGTRLRPLLTAEPLSAEATTGPAA